MKVKTADLTGKALDWATFCAAWPGATPTIEVYSPSKVSLGLEEIDVPGGVVLSYINSPAGVHHEQRHPASHRLSQTGF